MAYDIGPRIGISGEAEFRQAINALNTSFKTLGTEMAVVTSAFDKNDKSSKALTTQNGVLNKQIDTQKDKLVQLNSGLAQSTTKYGEADKVTQGWQQAVNRATAELNKMDRALADNNKNIALQDSNWTKMGKSLDSIGTKMKTVGEGFSSVGKKITMGITTPILGIGIAAGKIGMDFEAAMSRVKAISGATGEDFKKLNDQALQLGQDTAFSAGQAAEGMENLASAGFSVTEVMQAMPGMLDLAASGGLDVATASDIASAALRSFGLGADQSGHFADVLAKAAADTNANVTDMGMALKYAAAPAYALGLSVEEVSAAIGIMADAGIKGEQSGTTLRGALLALASPSGPAADAMKAIGLEVFDATGKMLPFKDVIGAVTESTKNLTQEEKVNALATIFGREAVSGMMVLIEKGPEKYDALTQSLVSSDGAAKAMAVTMQDNAKSSIEQMMGSLETAAIKIETAVAPTITKFANKLQELANTFSNLSPEMQGTLIKVALVAAAIGPVLIAVGSLITAVGTIATVFGAASTAIAGAGGIIAVLTGPIAIAIAAIAAIIAIGVLLYKNWDTIKAKAQELWASVTITFDNIKTSISTVWENIKTATLQAWESLKSAISNGLGAILNFIQPALTFYQTIFTNAWDIIKNIVLGAVLIVLDIVTGNFTKLGTDIGSIWNNIKTALMNIWEAIKGVAINAWDGLKNGVISITGSIRDGVFSVWNSILSFFRNLPGTLYNLGSSAFNSLKSGISSVLSTIGSTVSSGFNGAINFLTGLPGRAYGWGKDFIQGLINGIGNMINSVKNAAGGVGTAIRKILGFSVPEEGPLSAYESWMPDFMSGLAKGIEANKFKVTQAIQGLSTDMTMGVKYNALPSTTGISQDMVLKTAQEVARGVLGGMQSGGIVQNLVINSPTPLTPSEVARQSRNAMRELALNF